MLRIIELFNNLPKSYMIDKSAWFQPGQIGSLKIMGDKTVLGICDGINPVGIIDDIKTDKFRGIVWDKEIIVPAEHVELVSDSELPFQPCLAIHQKINLYHALIVKDSFVSNVPVILNAPNGVITFPKGTKLNYCTNLSADPNQFVINDALRLVIRYAYNTPNSKIDDSTLGSERVTVWVRNMIAETDMFDIKQEYKKYIPLYASNGFLSSKRTTAECKSIGFVLDLPSFNRPLLRFMLDLSGKIELGNNSHVEIY